MRNVKINLYEVGDIFLTLNNMNPGTRFKGTWELIAKGRTLVGVDPDDTDFDVVEKTGGEKTHKLTINEIPSHSHPQRVTALNSGSGVRRDYNSDGASSAFEQGISTGNTGGGQSHNNLQPYLTCYIWCRTA